MTADTLGEAVMSLNAEGKPSTLALEKTKQSIIAVAHNRGSQYEGVNSSLQQCLPATAPLSKRLPLRTRLGTTEGTDSGSRPVYLRAWQLEDFAPLIAVSGGLVYYSASNGNSSLSMVTSSAGQYLEDRTQSLGFARHAKRATCGVTCASLALGPWLVLKWQKGSGLGGLGASAGQPLDTFIGSLTLTFWISTLRTHATARRSVTLTGKLDPAALPSSQARVLVSSFSCD